MPAQGVSSAISPERQRYCQEIGDNAELVIAPSFFEDMGWEYRNSSPNENRTKHFDYIVTRADKEYKVEVKAPKSCRNPKYSNFRLVLLEHTGISGYPGWLRGEADIILQVLSNDRIIAYRRLDALHAYNPPGSEVMRCYSKKAPLHRWFGRRGLSRAGTPNQDIIRWEHYKVFAEKANALIYRKVNGRWQRPALN